MKPPVDVPTPYDVVMATSTAPMACAGDVAVICHSESTVNDTLIPSNLTELAPVNFSPPIVTLVPPAVGPWLGEISTMAGTHCVCHPAIRFSIKSITLWLLEVESQLMLKSIRLVRLVIETGMSPASPVSPK